MSGPRAFLSFFSICVSPAVIFLSSLILSGAYLVEYRMAENTTSLYVRVRMQILEEITKILYIIGMDFMAVSP